MSATQQLWDAVLAERGRAERVARARCASPQDAEDCVQEAMARVVAMPAVDRTRIGPLLATVTAHLAADTHRLRSRATRAEPRLRAWATAPVPPEDVVCDAEEARWLWTRRDALGAQDREVLELRAQGRTVAETAEELGLTYKATEASYTRARAKMRAIWRATAAAIGILCGRPRRCSAATKPAYVAVATVALAFVLLPGASEPSPIAPVGPPRAAPPTAPALITSDADVARDPVALPTAGGSVRDGRRPVAAGPAGERRQIARRESTRLGVVSVGGTTVTNEREQEDLGQTLERCVREGLVVSLTEIDCAG